MKNIIITGANRGIGLELAKLFSKDGFVYALCRSEFPTVHLNDHIKVVDLDVTDEDAIKRFAESLNGSNVAVDLLINNAGIAGYDKSNGARIDSTTVTEVFKTNIIGPMILTLHLTNALKKSEHPVMLAISSRMGTHALLNSYNAQFWPYSSSKAALSFAVSAYVINEPSIKSISIHPGWVRTDMGGSDADIDPSESAKGIKKLYDTIDNLESGKLYNYDGSLMAW